MADIVLDQHFLVCTQQSKAAWQNDLRQEILLQTTYSAANNGNQGTNAVDINKYILSNGFMNNRQYVQAIYNWYQELFIQKSTLFPWAGLARLAGGGVYAGLSDNQWGQNSYQVGQAMITGLPTLASLALLWNHDGVTTAQIISAECSYFQQALMDGQQLIYGDLAWQFRAYQASGIWALRYTSSSNLDKIPGTKYIPIDEQHTWETIFQADYHNSLSLTQSGNFNVTQREQQVIVQPAWDLIATDRYGLGTGLFSFLAQSPVPGGASFSDVVPGGNIANVNHRWIWVSQQAANFSPIFTPPYSSYININGIWPDWIALTTAQQLQDANGSLQTLAYNDSLLIPIIPITQQ